MNKDEAKKGEYLAKLKSKLNSLTVEELLEVIEKEVVDRLRQVVIFRYDDLEGTPGFEFPKLMVCPPQIDSFITLTDEDENDKRTFVFRVTNVDYYLNSEKPGETIFVYCNLELEDIVGLPARK